MNKKVVIVSAVRTPIGSFMGALSSVPATKLGAAAIKGALNKINLDPKLVDEVLMGNVVQAGNGQAPARQAALYAGLSESVACTTVNKVCASGMKAVMQGAQAIMAGDAEIVVAGGMENMSLIPHYVHLRNGVKFGPTSLVDGMQKDGLTDAYDNNAMGVCADLCASEYKITREEQDAFALHSHEKAIAAIQSGRFQNDIVPVEVERIFLDANEKRQIEKFTVATDEGPRASSLEALAGLKPVFANGGSVTAGNSSQTSDGAAFVLVMSEKMVKELNLEPIARLASYAVVGVEPRIMGIGPVDAIPKAIKMAGLNLSDINLFELNEAFASQSIAVIRETGLNPDLVNVNGGAIALGHPLGCTGAKLSVQIMNELKKRQQKYGVVTMCVGTGQGAAGVIEML